jgi:addiction module HigA family antidote
MTTSRPEPGEALVAAGVEPVPPGAYLARYVFPHRHVTIAQAAEAMGLPAAALRRLMDDQLRVDSDLAGRLSVYTGLSKGFWLNLQAAADRSRQGRSAH